MQRSSLWKLGLALVAALASTQCNSLADDCKKTLTCGDAGAPRLNPRTCKWYFPDGGEWEDGPTRNGMTGRWEWPNGSPAPSFDCDANGGGGAGAPDNCTNNPVPRPDQIRCDPLYCEPESTNCVECLNNAHCQSSGDAGASSGRVCNTEIFRCIECNNDRDCAGTGTPYCKQSATNAAQNACVQCLRNADCTSPEVCDVATGDCTLRCTRTEDCRGAKPACSIPEGEIEGVCVECLDDSTCDGGTPQCNTTTKQCVQCTTNMPCGPLGRVCDTVANQCVRCTAQDHCMDEGETPHCDVTDHQCVECLDHADCTDVTKSRCNPGNNTCAGCTQDPQCEEAAPKCRLSDGQCVVCLDNDDCPGVNNRCDLASGRCVGCLTDADCPLVNLARCELAAGPNQFTCVPCNASDATPHAECAGKTEGGFCSSNNICVDCLTNGDCFDDGPGLSQCNGAGTCVACSDDDDCDLFTSPARRACRVTLPNPGCVECVNNNHCIGNPNGPRCKTTTGGGQAAINTCVECITNADCTNPAFSKCINNQCEPCGVGSTNDETANAACSHLSNLGVCDISESDGVCVQCTGLQRQACAAGANVCNSITRQCTAFAVGSAVNNCASCVSDAHCASNARCIQQTFDGTNVGFFCFPLQAAGSCATRGFAQLTTTTTIDDAIAAVCLQRETTCPAFADYGELQVCTGEADDAACGVAGLADGSCVPRAAGFVCSINCEFVDDCPAGVCTNGACPQQ